MTTIRITHRAGVGDWPLGVTVTLEDRHAQKLVGDGYAERVETVTVKRATKEKPSCRKD